MIKVYLVVCDSCGKLIDATKDTYYQHDNHGDLCHYCYHNIFC